MVELQHNTPPAALMTYLKNHPHPTVADFNSIAFHAIKPAIRQQLHSEQGGLCVYCERKLDPAEGQIDHIKPKGGKNGHPHLCFFYTNYAYSCINPKTCGQKKKEGLLPIEPVPGCNQHWFLNHDGYIEPIVSLSKKSQHPVRQTNGMLGLNNDPSLIRSRKQWLDSMVTILQQSPQNIELFLQQAPYRYILGTVL